MKVFFTALFCLGFFACQQSTSPSGNQIALGIYQISAASSSGDYDQIQFSEGGNFASRYYYKNCIEIESIAEYKIDGDKISLFNKKRHAKSDETNLCGSAFGPYSTSPDNSTSIRNVNDTAFELLNPATESSPASWDTWHKL
jgi:hypothetical protein